MHNLYRDAIYSVIQVLEHHLLNPHLHTLNIVAEKTLFRFLSV